MHLLYALLLAGHFGQAPKPAPKPGPKPPASVYICQGSASYAYHRRADCEGLAWCSSSAKALSKAAALRLGRRPCGRCAY